MRVTKELEIGGKLAAYHSRRTVNFLVGERLGRRYVIWMAMVWVTVGTTLQISAYSVPHLVIGRIVTGIGTGLKSSTIPMYVYFLLIVL
jgi:predicted MFS family arabinose efflux permease